MYSFGTFSFSKAGGTLDGPGKCVACGAKVPVGTSLKRGRPICGRCVNKAAWTGAMINDLPDSAFAYVEPGDKDAQGKTVPRSKRHFPLKGSDGQYDAPHVRNALARASQFPEFGNKAMPAIAAAAKALKIGQYTQGE